MNLLCHRLEHLRSPTLAQLYTKMNGYRTHLNSTVESRHSSGPKTFYRQKNSQHLSQRRRVCHFRLRKNSTPSRTLVLFFANPPEIPQTAYLLPQKGIGPADWAIPVTATSIASMPSPAALINVTCIDSRFEVEVDRARPATCPQNSRTENWVPRQPSPLSPYQDN